MQSTSKTEYVNTVCPLDCPDSCGIVAKVVDGVVESLNGASDHPFTRGMLCRKMRKYLERVYSENRIVYPQVRVGKKGEGRFKRIGWDEALEIFADKIKETISRHGAEAILPYQFAGNMGVLSQNAGYALYNKLGTSTIKETICSAAAGAAWAMHLSNVPGSPPELAENADLIVAWGINVKVSNVHFWQYIAKARKKGAKLVVIDPYRNETGRSADEYIQILPGGDGALALGTLKAILEMGRIDVEALADHTIHFNKLKQYLEQTPWAEFTRLSGLEKEQIVAFGQLLADNPKTFIRIGIGLSRNSRGGMNVRSILSLGAALGLFAGGEGKGVLLSSKAFSGDSSVLRFPELSEKTSREINMAHLGHALTSLSPPVKMFVVYNCNPLSVAPDSSMVRQGLEREDLFTVVHEQVMTPTAKYADLLLPATTFLENKDLYTGYGHFEMAVVDRVIEPVGETKSNFDLFQQLAKELGFSDSPFLQTEDERIASYVATMDGLPEDFSYNMSDTTGWITSTRKRIYESVKKRWNVPFCFAAEEPTGNFDFPTLLEPVEFADPDLLSRFPLRLIIPPHRDLLNSTFGDMYEGEMGEVLVHPADAQKFCVSDSSPVQLVNSRGVAVRKARITENTQQGTVIAEGIYWRLDGEDGINGVTSQKNTDIADGPTFHESLVILRSL